MAITIDVLEADPERLYTEVSVAGLTVGERYDIYRLRMIYDGKDPETGEPVYEIDPRNRNLWSGVAHRIGWVAPEATVTFRDYDAPLTSYRYFVMRTSLISPFEYDWSDGPFPLTRGVLSDEVVHFNRLISEAEAAYSEAARRALGGEVVIRSTAELGKFISLCVESFDVKYQARGTEHPVMRRQYPIYVADTREARRGSVVLLTRTMEEYDELREIVFPPSGVIRPIEMSTGPGATVMLDNMRVVPLDVGIENAGYANPEYRFVTLDFIEVDPKAPLVARSGDNDDLVNAPKANFAITDTTPKRGGLITLTDTSTGQYDSWEWFVSRGGRVKPVRRYTQGPHKVSFPYKGRYSIKLRVYGSVFGTSKGASTIIKKVNVW